MALKPKIATKKSVTKTKVGAYDADAIVWSRGLEGPRNDPSMYLSSADGDAACQMGVEIVANASDELTAIGGGTITLTIDKDHLVTVSDTGRGVPVEPHKLDKKRSTVEIVFSELHAGGKGKGSGDAYAASSGTHGVGAAVTNACSRLFKADVKRDGKVHHIAWAKGVLKAPLKVVGKCPKTDTGTTVTFRYDETVLTGTPNWRKLVNWIEAVSYFTPTITYVLDVVIPGAGKAKGEYVKRTIKRKNGMADWIADHAPKKADALGKPFTINTEHCDIALQWFGSPDDNLQSFVSAARTKDGGTHAAALHKALTVVLDKYTGKRGASKKSYKPEDLRVGLTGCVNIRIKSPKFTSQTKEKLSSPEGGEVVYALAVKELTKFFDKNKALAKSIIERANAMRGAKDDFKLTAKAAAELKPKRGTHGLPSKLATSKTRIASERELYLVEGDSAFGCFSPLTEVRLADNRSISFLDLVADFAKGIDHTGLSWDATNKVFVPIEFDHPRITKYVTEMIELTMDDGSVTVCTPDHMWLLETGEYKRADSLTNEDRLREYLPPAIDPS